MVSVGNYAFSEMRLFYQRCSIHRSVFHNWNFAGRPFRRSNIFQNFANVTRAQMSLHSLKRYFMLFTSARATFLTRLPRATLFAATCARVCPEKSRCFACTLTLIEKVTKDRGWKKKERTHMPLTGFIVRVNEQRNERSQQRRVAGWP